MVRLPRLLSLDIFRGLTIAAMILVNSPGNETAYAWLEHAEWNGLTPTDLVFPFFLFIVGASLAISLGNRLAREDSKAEILKQVWLRTLILFALGLLLNGFPKYDLMTLRIFGVLQRIALCYAAGALIYLHSNDRGRWIWLAALLLGYWALIAGDLSPEGNLAARLDRFLLSGHLYRPHYDPEGLLSTIPAIATVVLGIQATPRLRSNHQLVVGGLACVVIGWIWSFIFPLNKALWTSSYVLVTGGLAMILWWLIDKMAIKGYGGALFIFEALGLNAIAAYVLHLLFLKIQNRIPMPRPDGSASNFRLWVSDLLFGTWLSPMNASLAYAICYTAFWMGFFYMLYRKRIFWKV